jgi:hypothetical protein
LINTTLKKRVLSGIIQIKPLDRPVQCHATYTKIVRNNRSEISNGTQYSLAVFSQFVSANAATIQTGTRICQNRIGAIGGTRLFQIGLQAGLVDLLLSIYSRQDNTSCSLLSFKCRESTMKNFDCHRRT